MWLPPQSSDKGRRIGSPGTPLVTHRKFLATALTLGLAIAGPGQAQQQNPTAAKPPSPPAAPPAPAAPAAPPKPPTQAKGPAKPAAPAAKLDRAEAIKRANAFFNTSPVLTADFVQLGADGKRSEGKFYVQRAGRVRFEYAEPATMEVVSDGLRVVVRDRKLKSEQAYFIEQTPLKFFIKEKFDLEKDVKVVDVAIEDFRRHDRDRGQHDIRRNIAGQAALRPQDLQAQAVAGDGSPRLSDAAHAVQHRPDDDARSRPLQARAESELALNAPADWRLFRSFRGGLKGSWRYDLFAGLTLAAIAVPEQMATARLGGFPAHIGFFAFLAGSIAFAVFGSSRYLSAGANSTITPIFAGALGALVSSHSSAYPQLALILALAVGALLTLAGLFRAGWVADLLSIPVTTGFLAGIAVHIAVSQAPALLGLPPGPPGVLESLAAVWNEIRDANTYALTIGLASLLCISLCEWLNPRIPGALIALAAATLAVVHLGLAGKGVAVVGGFEAIMPHHLAVDPQIWGDLPRVFGLAVVVAVVVMVQTAAVSRSFPDAPGQSPDVDRDFLGLGAGSVLAGLVGAFPVNASPPRTAIVVESGGRSQWAAIVACCVVAAVALYGSPLLEKVPEAALAGVLFFIAGRLVRLRDIRAIAAKTRAELLLVVATALLVTILPIQTGVGLAILLSLAHGVFTTTRTRLIEFERLPGASIWWPHNWSLPGEKLEGVVVVAFQAPLSFLNAYGFRSDLEEAIARAQAPVRLVILEASSNVEIDYTAAQILDETIRRCRAQGVDFAIARLESVRAQAALERYGVSATLGEGHLFHSVDQATQTLAPNAAVRPA